MEKFAPLIIAIPILLLVVTGYVKAPPDKAFIISGLKRRIIVGRAAIRVPFFERLDKLSLKVMSVDVKTGTAVPTNDYINVRVDGIVKIKVPNNRDMIERAAQNFLNQTEEYIIAQVKDVLEGNMREIIGQLTLPTMVQDRKSFGEKVQENAVPDLEKLGLEIVSFNIQSFEDENGVIENLGIDNISKIRKDAAIAKAIADKDVVVAQANANKEANDAEVESQRIIAERQNELAIKKAQLKAESDRQKAEADMAYDIQTEERRKDKETKIAEANLIREQKQIEIQKAKLDAEQRQVADVELYQRQQEAQAKLFEESKQAEAIRIRAENEASAIKLKAQAEAEAKKSVGLAEAEAIRARGLAEAEAIDKKAEAMKKYGEGAILEMYFKAMPEIARNIAEPLTKVDKITMYGDGNNSKLVGDITKSLTQITDGLNDSMGLDLKSLLLGALGTGLMSKHVTVNNIPEDDKEVEDKPPICLAKEKEEDDTQK
ncbi:MAG: SPFH domain-containing protein [Filifactor alocis]|nr:SPFH domain-containing protein [Filifactor alocis]